LGFSLPLKLLKTGKSRKDVPVLRWCCYCQKYLGETEPFSSFEITHGICPDCAKRGLAFTPQAFQKLKTLSKYQGALWDAGALGDLRSARSLVDEGVAMNLRALDILMGLVTPALYRVGNMWDRQEISVVEEHRFTRYYEQVLEILFDYIYLPETKPAPQVVLTCSVSNIHTLGVRILDLTLLAQGISVFSICPGVPNGELIKTLQKFKPKILGISIATSEQLRDLEELSFMLEDLVDRPKVYVGGSLIKNTMEVPELPHIQYEWRIDKFIEAVADTAPPFDPAHFHVH
jgi:methanogenic corrinoid protein MtbC1